jgi:hypothetical protein
MLENIEKIETVTYDVVNDIMTIYGQNKSGFFQLPDDVPNSNSVFYEFENFPPFAIECLIEYDLEGNDFIDIDGNFIPPASEDDEDDEYESVEDDYIIEVIIHVNPKFIGEATDEIKDELFDIIGHELAHLVQKESHYEFPDDELTEPLKYYGQEHELEAQLVGFILKSRKTGQPLEDVVRRFFEGKRVKFNLSQTMIDELTDMVLKYIKEKQNVG